MRTLHDVVLEHAKTNPGGGTSDGLEFLELEHDSKNYCAANTYIASLEVIVKLQKKIEYLEKQLAY